MLAVGKPIFFPNCLPFCTLPSIDQFLFKNLFAFFNFPFCKKFRIKDEETIFLLISNGCGLIIL